MNHLDEGTIHAWLDGALDAAQSADAEAHVKGCAECSAKVAEARGLIAASSRILTSLDDVPANVIPMKAPERKRSRRIAPWVSGLAAAVVLVTLWRTGGVEQKPATKMETLPEVQVTPASPPPSLERLKEPAPPVAARPAAQVASRPGPAAARRAETDQAGVGSAEIGRVAGAANEERKDEASSVMGCYRIASVAQQDAAASQVAEQPQLKATAGAAARGASIARAREAAPAAAPAAAMQKSSADMAVPIITVRLDSGNVVRIQGTDSTIGTWQAISGDSTRLTIRGQSSTVLAPSKVRCP
jgi:anti-sigma factor RsiW